MFRPLGDFLSLFSNFKKTNFCITVENNCFTLFQKYWGNMVTFDHHLLLMILVSLPLVGGLLFCKHKLVNPCYVSWSNFIKAVRGAGLTNISWHHDNLVYYSAHVVLSCFKSWCSKLNIVEDKISRAWWTYWYVICGFYF